MRRVLEDEQYQVSILQDGRDAFTRVKTQLPDLLILDLKLGEVSGQDILKQLKDDYVTVDIPVIVYTAAVLEAEEVSRLIASNPTRYQDVHVVQKPFELENLLNLVQQVYSSVGTGSKASSGVARLLDYGGLPVDMLMLVLGPSVMGRHGLLFVEGHHFSGLVKEGGVSFDDHGDIFVQTAYYNAKPLNWSFSSLSSQRPRHPEHQTSRGYASDFNATVWADPYETITAAGADDGYTGLNLSRGVFGYNQTATRLIRDNTHAVKGARLRADTGLLVVIEVSSVNARHGVNVPKSWGNPVASYVRGGKTRLAYRIDHGTTVTFTPETAIRKRVFHDEGTPTYHGRYLPLASADPEADVARLANIAPTTVRYHIENAVKKLNATNRRAVRLFCRLRLRVL